LYQTKKITLWKQLLLTLHQIFYNVFNISQNDETNVFFSLMVLHCSRAFMDPDPQAISRSLTILEFNLAQVNDGSFSSYEHMVSEDSLGLLAHTLQLFREILFSEKFQSVLRGFLFYYGSSSKLADVNAFIQNKLKIIFVKNGYFCGMCGRNGEIYFSRTDVERILNISVVPDLNSVTETNSFIIGTGIHELAHALLREIILKNELLSPRGFSEPEKIEAGYKLEEMAFGCVLSDFKMVSRIDKKENWTFSGNDVQQVHFQKSKFIKKIKKIIQNFFAKFLALFF